MMNQIKQSLVFATVLWFAAMGPGTAQADFSTCAVPWNVFTASYRNYTLNGQVIADHESSSDPTTGGSGSAPDSVDLASGSPAGYPGPGSTAAYSYYDGGTPWNPANPASMGDDRVLFVFRLNGLPLSSKGDFASYHWNILLDVDGDGYKEYWVDLEGAYQSSGNTDRLQVLYDDKNTQIISNLDQARVAEFSASGDPLANPACLNGSPGRSHTRVSATNDGTGDYYLEIQLPLSAFKDASGNQVVFPDTPLGFVYSTGTSNNDPLQKDLMCDINYLGSSNPITFGDVVTIQGAARVDFTDRFGKLVDYYTAGDPLYVRLTADAGDPEAIDCLAITIADPMIGYPANPTGPWGSDAETVQVCETGLDTGVYINTLGDCTLRSTATRSAWLTGIVTSSSTATTWTVEYGSGTTWNVLKNGALVATATAGTPFSYPAGALVPEISFTLYQNPSSAPNPPQPGEFVRVCALPPLATSTTNGGTADDETLLVAALDTIRADYYSPAGSTTSVAADLAQILGVGSGATAVCSAGVQFTRATGLLTDIFLITSDTGTSDDIFVTVTSPSANTNASSAQTLSALVEARRPDGSLIDSHVLTLQETGVNTGVFRNPLSGGRGLQSQIFDGSAAINTSPLESLDGATLKAVVTVGSGLGSPCSGTDYAATKIQGAGGTIGFTDWTGIQAVGYYVAGDPLFVKVNDVTWATCGAAPFTATVKSCTADTTIPGTCATGTVTDSVTIALTQTAVTPAPSGIFLPWVMDLTTTAGSALVGATSGSPIAAAQVGGTFYIGSGSDAGAYLITEMNGGSLTLDRALTATATSVPYSVNPPTFEDYVEGDPAPVPGADTILVVQPGQVVVAEFLDCNDGDPDATNNVKTAAALYYPSAGDTPTSSLDTRATIRGLRVDRTGVVEFATGTQQGTRGFSIFETDDRAGSALRSVTSRPVRVRTADSRVPILYRVETAPITGRYLVIEEIEAGGSRRLMGPFEIGNARLTRAFERLDAAFTASGVAPRGRAYRLERVRGALTGARGLERASAVRNWRAAQRRGGGDGVRIEVSRPGTVRIPAADLEALGVNLRTRRLNLSSLGQAVPYTIERGAAGQQLVFRATPLETDYTRVRSYLLTVGTSPSMRAGLTASGTPATPGFTRIERSSQYLASAPRTSDPFLWDMLWPGMAWPDPEWTVDPTGEFDLPGYQAPSAGTPVPVRIGFVSASAHGHEVSAFLNGGDGEPIGRLRMDGVGNGVLEGWIDAAALRETGNVLRLVYDSNPAFDWNSDESWNDFPRFYLDWVEIGIPEPTLESPVPGEAIVLDRYDPGLPPLGGIDYLVLTHPMFREAADRIAAAKRSENLAAVVVDTDRIYDRFTAGTIEPEAIREAVRFALRESQGRLGYVLLIGDDTWDPTNRTGLGSPSFLPSLLAWNEGGGYGRIPSDHRYADVDGDGIPDVAIGRLPVSSLDEAATVAAKIERQAAVLQASAGRHLLLTDGSDPIFSRRAAAAARQLPAGSATATLELTGDSLGEVTAGLRGGAGAVHYLGHGGIDQLTLNSTVLSSEVAEAFADTPEAVLFLWACQAQDYRAIAPFGAQSVAEALLTLPLGGALASFGPAGVTDERLQAALRERLYVRLFREGLSLGEAIRRAKADALQADPGTRDVVEGWNLLGDPALRLPGSPPGASQVEAR